MSHIAISNVAYSHPGGDSLFEAVSFKLSPGEHAGLVGANGVGKSTLMRILAGELAGADGSVGIGSLAYMAQNVGIQRPHETDVASIWNLLLGGAPMRLRTVGDAIGIAERDLAAGGDPADAGMRLGEALSEWSELGGYELESRWDAACRQILRAGLDDVRERPVAAISGGERKRLVLEVMFDSEASVLLLDEPDNFLDIRAKRELENRIATSPKTILLISHDREVLGAATTKILTLESRGVWVHGDSYRTYPEARERRQEQLGASLGQWNREERRLFDYYKTMKQRAKISSDLATRAVAAETRWKRFVAIGPPPAPARATGITVRIHGGDSARLVIAMRALSIDDVVRAFDAEIHFGERIGLIGPNGSGKTHLIRVFAGETSEHKGDLRIGNRVSPGLFAQVYAHSGLAGRAVLDVVREREGDQGKAMAALARYGLQRSAARTTDTLSGGQEARLAILLLEMEGRNLLLLDEPTDNLDIESADALENALDCFVGTVVAVSHDRSFLRRLDRFLFLSEDGDVYEIPDVATALAALQDPAAVPHMRFVKLLAASRAASPKTTMN